MKDQSTPHWANTAVISAGNPGLDHILNGGLTPNRLYLIEGDPGAGKTTIAMQFIMEGLKNGERCLYVTLSETKAELIAMAKSHGWSIDKADIFELIPSEDMLKPDSQYSVFHPSEVELGETTRAILNEVERIKPTRVVFDSLSELRLLAQNSLRFRRQILALKQFFSGRHCTVVSLDDKTSDTGDEMYSIAHGVILLERLSPGYGTERRRLEVRKIRARPYRGGFHDYVIRTGSLDIFPRLIAAEHRSEVPDETLTSGLTALDALLGGGIDRATSTLMLGPTGVGKTTLVLQYVLAAARRKEKTAFFSFDENLRTLMKRSKAMGLDIETAINKGHVKITSIDPAELSPGEFAHLVREAVEKDGVRIVVIDSLNGYLNAMPEERFLTIQLHEMLTYLAQMGVSTFLVVAQHGLIGNMNTPVDASYVADTVVLLRYFEAEGRVRKAVSVLKKRSGRHEDTIRELIVGEHGPSLSEPLRKFSGVLTGIPMARAANGSQDDAKREARN